MALAGPQGSFQLFAKPLIFLLETFNLPLLSFNLLSGPVQLLGANELNRIGLPSALPLVSRGSHPLYGNVQPYFAMALSIGFQRGKQIPFFLLVPGGLADGCWSAQVNYGGPQDAGFDFELAAVVVTQAVHESWLGWVQSVKNTGLFPPVQLPTSPHVLGESFQLVHRAAL
ncbi:MAG: hypothetical protein KIT09_30250 [Bryobacteraceae bacterium]|nr:hypothetical protein [Bryobacteraceae bacterium]